MLVISMSARAKKLKTCLVYVGLLTLIISGLSAHCIAQGLTLYTLIPKSRFRPVNLSVMILTLSTRTVQLPMQLFL